MGGKNIKTQIVVFGTSAVGKTALIYRYTHDEFIENYDPTIDDKTRTSKMIDDCICTIDIQDTCGIDQFKTMREMYIRESDGFLIVFARNSKASFKDLKGYYDTICQYKEKDRIIGIVMNKIDLEDQEVSDDEIKSFVDQTNSMYIKTSAKTNINVTEAFEMVIRKVIEKKNKKAISCHLL